MRQRAEAEGRWRASQRERECLCSIGGSPEVPPSKLEEHQPHELGVPSISVWLTALLSISAWIAALRQSEACLADKRTSGQANMRARARRSLSWEAPTGAPSCQR